MIYRFSPLGLIPSILATAIISFTFMGCEKSDLPKDALGEAREEENSSGDLELNASELSDLPLLIPCEACKSRVSKKSKQCTECGHPTIDSILSFRNYEEAKLEEAKFEEANLGDKLREELIQDTEGRFCLPQTNQLFNGSLVEKYSDGTIKSRIRVKDGYPVGLVLEYDENGREKGPILRSRN